LNRTGVTSLN